MEEPSTGRADSGMLNTKQRKADLRRPFHQKLIAALGHPKNPRRLAAAALLNGVREAGLVNVEPRVKRFEGHYEDRSEDLLASRRVLRQVAASPSAPPPPIENPLQI